MATAPGGELRGPAPSAVPKLRRGSYFPDWLLDPRRRSEKTLTSVVAEVYVKVVSSQRVNAPVQSMGMDGISKSQASVMAKNLDEFVEAFPLPQPEDDAWATLIHHMGGHYCGRVQSVALGQESAQGA